jgi:hypothetical protein
VISEPAATFRDFEGRVPIFPAYLVSMVLGLGGTLLGLPVALKLAEQLTAGNPAMTPELANVSRWSGIIGGVLGALAAPWIAGLLVAGAWDLELMELAVAAPLAPELRLGVVAAVVASRVVAEAPDPALRAAVAAPAALHDLPLLGLRAEDEPVYPEEDAGADKVGQRDRPQTGPEVVHHGPQDRGRELPSERVECEPQKRELVSSLFFHGWITQVRGVGFRVVAGTVLCAAPAAPAPAAPLRSATGATQEHREAWAEIRRFRMTRASGGASCASWAAGDLDDAEAAVFDAYGHL